MKVARLLVDIINIVLITVELSSLFACYRNVSYIEK